MRLDTAQSVKLRLQAAGLWSKKRLGQHFLIDASVLETVADTAMLSKSDTVVEVGPGMGVLSRVLLERAGKVVAFEYDRDMVRMLALDLPELKVIEGDVLKTAPAALGALGSYKLVANIPYQITTPLLRLFMEGSHKPASMTLLVQREVGQRLTAKAATSGRGYLSVLCDYFADTSYVKTVPPEAFYPPPRVDSAVINLVIRDERRFSDEEEIRFLKFVHTLFVNPRKQLKNVFAGIRGVGSSDVEPYFLSLGLKPTVRAQELTLDDWVKLFTMPVGGSNG